MFSKIFDFRNLRVLIYTEKLLLFPILFLLALSILEVFSTTNLISEEMYGSTWKMGASHLVHIIFGLAAMLLCCTINLQFLRKISPLLLGGTIFLMLLVAIPGIGHEAGGARRWISLGGVKIQPGEFLKLTFLIFLCLYLEKFQDKLQKFKFGILVPCLMLGFLSGLLLIQPDFGTTVIIVLVSFIVIGTSAKITQLFFVVIIAILMMVGLVISSPYRLKRLETFFDPLKDTANSGYQLSQSLIAITSGGLWGSGLGAGQQKLFYLPAAHNDFIFAVIAEELGFLGVLLVIAAFFLIALRGYRIVSKRSDDIFTSNLALGCTVLLVLPAVLNICVVTGLLPTKGLVLPLVSYGGTAMIVNLTLVGLLIRAGKEKEE